MTIGDAVQLTAAHCPNKRSLDPVEWISITPLFATVQQIKKEEETRNRINIQHSVCIGKNLTKWMCFLRHIGQFIGNRYGPGSGPIWLGDVACTGDETDFTQCGHAGWGRPN